MCVCVCVCVCVCRTLDHCYTTIKGAYRSIPRLVIRFLKSDFSLHIVKIDLLTTLSIHGCSMFSNIYTNQIITLRSFLLIT